MVRGSRSKLPLPGLLALLMTASPSMAAAAPAVPSVAPPASLVPLDLRFGPAPVPVAGEGRDHLLYELRLTNFSGRPLTLAGIDVIDEADGKLIAHHAATDLAEMIGTPGRKAMGAERLALPPAGFAIVHFDTTLPAGTAAGARLRHLVRIEGGQTGENERRTQVASEPLAVAAGPALILDAPLSGADWLAANALSNASDHRRTMAVIDGKARIAQRYAIDFLRLDAEGRAFIGDPAQNANWAGYGAPVLAVADAVVERVQDGLPDNQPFAPPAQRLDLETIGGNHVVLALPGGQRVFYGHLQPGSIRVKQGQKVRQGEAIGLVGNSGQSDAPHLHIHVADGASALGAEGIAFAFRRFRLNGHVPSLAVLEGPDGWSKPADVPSEERRGELPVENAVIEFPDR